MIKVILVAMVWAMLATVQVATGDIEIVQFDDEKRQARYLNLVNEMRCLVCQNQTLADSNAPLAQDMRTVIRQMLEDGATDLEVIDFLVARYGDFVLYRPPLVPRTLVLWFAPFVFLLLALVLVPFFISRRRVVLDEAARAAAQKLLRE